MIKIHLEQVNWYGKPNAAGSIRKEKTRPTVVTGLEAPVLFSDFLQRYPDIY